MRGWWSLAGEARLPWLDSWCADHVVDQDDVRTSTAVVESGVLPPGTYSFGAGLVAEAGVCANPALRSMRHGYGSAG